MPLNKELLVLACLAIAILAGCGSRPDPVTTRSIGNDQGHPIILAPKRHWLNIPVSPGDRHLNGAVRDAILGFAQNYKATSSATITLSLPALAHPAGAEIRAVLYRAGISGRRLVVTGNGQNGLVTLSYVSMTAMTDMCGQWPDDLADTGQNRNWHNFGCATQQNLAAQIANPMDLLAPRAMTSIDAQQRSGVIRVYREGDAIPIATP